MIVPSCEEIDDYRRLLAVVTRRLPRVNAEH
jgi:hypothetical protein